VSHVRAQIAAAIAATLADLPTSGPRVHVARPADWPIAAAQLPAVLIYADAESISSNEVAAWPRRLVRDMDVRIEALAEGMDDAEATLSRMLAEIEFALNASKLTASCGGLLLMPLLLTALDVAREADGERTIGRLATTWTCSYTTYSNAPETAAT
jgi:hypothetical protein